MPLSKIVKYFLIWQVLIVVVTLLSPSFFPLRQSNLGGTFSLYRKNPLLYSRGNFEGIHYINISQKDYGYAEQSIFPMYPRLIHSLKFLISDHYLAGVVISLISFLAGLIILNKLLSLDYSPVVAKWTILALLFFPTSFFFGSVYTEGLFFFLVVASFYFARTRHWILATLLAAAATNTRLIGIVLLPALIIEMWQLGQPTVRKFLPILLIPLGLISYMWYLQHTTGDPLAFIAVTDIGIVLPYQVLWRYLKMVTSVGPSTPAYPTLMLEAVVGIMFLVTSIYSFIKHRLSYAVFNSLVYLIPTLTGNFVSLPRYVLICFPSFILAGQLLAKSKLGRVLTFTIFIASLTVFLMMFVSGYWVS